MDSHYLKGLLLFLINSTPWDIDIIVHHKKLPLLLFLFVMCIDRKVQNKFKFSYLQLNYNKHGLPIRHHCPLLWSAYWTSFTRYLIFTRIIQVYIDKKHEKIKQWQSNVRMEYYIDSKFVKDANLNKYIGSGSSKKVPFLNKKDPVDLVVKMFQEGLTWLYLFF